MLGYYAYNPKTDKVTSIDYLSLIQFNKHPEKITTIIREKLRKRIRKEKI